MRAVSYSEFRGPITVGSLPDPSPPTHGAVLRVHACGVCRSDWHGWQGHDPDIRSMPHVPGHEIAGVVEAVGSGVKKWKQGARVTVPFVCGCGSCPQCVRGHAQVCDAQTQPGFTHWGAFAEYVVIHHADVNLVALPLEVDFVDAASLGCRFATSFRAIVDQGAVREGEWVAVHGCGGIGLSAVMIAAAAGARVIAVDIAPSALEAAREAGASVALLSSSATEVSEQIRELTAGGADLSCDALGSAVTAEQSIRSLAKGGRHVQIGLLVGADHHPRLPMELVIARELRLIGSHGLAAVDYSRLLQQVVDGKLRPGALVTRRLGLADVPAEIAAMGPPAPGVTPGARRGIAVVERFD